MKIDLSTVIGLTVAYTLVGLGMFLAAGGDIGLVIALFINQPDSAAITIGGSLGATICCYPLTRIKLLVKIIKSALFSNAKNFAYGELIEELLGYAKEARKSGILALDEKLEQIQDSFIKTGIQLAVDGTTREQMQEILWTDVQKMSARHATNQAILLKWAEMAPAYGMIGTLIGLIAMLANLSDPDSIGPAMSVALITTMYGSMMANMICIPLASKLSNNTESETLKKEIIITGILAIQNGDNPAVVKQKLIPFLPPDARLQISGDE